MAYLKKGYQLKGPEPFINCYNTGKAPLVWRLKQRMNEVEYLVFENEIDEDETKIIVDACYSGKRKHKARSGNFWTFKTMSPARKKFSELCESNREKQAEQMRTVLELRAKAEKGDMAAAMELSNY